MVNKKVLENSNCFNENIRIGEDVILWSELAHKGLVYGIDKPLTLVRMHGQNAANTPENQIVGDNNILKYGILMAQDISWKQKRRFLSNKYHNIAYNYYRVNNKRKAVLNLAYSFCYDPFRASRLLYSDLLGLGKRLRRFFK